MKGILEVEYDYDVVGADESVVVVVTGNGLKDTESAGRAGGDATQTAPLDDVVAEYPDAS